MMAPPWSSCMDRAWALGQWLWQQAAAGSEMLHVAFIAGTERYISIVCMGLDWCCLQGAWRLCEGSETKVWLGEQARCCPT